MSIYRNRFEQTDARIRLINGEKFPACLLGISENPPGLYIMPEKDAEATIFLPLSAIAMVVVEPAKPLVKPFPSGIIDPRKN